MEDLLQKNIEAYLDLLAKSLTGDLYRDPPLPSSMKKNTLKYRLKRYLGLAKASLHDAQKRETGADWPSVAPSMIGRKRMHNIRQLCEDVVRKNIPGDFIETGVWRGGACIYARAIFNAYGEKNRKVWVADSFAGLPKPKPGLYPADEGDRHFQYAALAVSQEEVQENFERYGVMGDNVRFLKGWFKDTLPSAPIDRLSILRLDGDMYESTMDGLQIYDKVSVGGYVIVDDYGSVEACKKAIHDFRNQRGIKDEIIDIDGYGVYWKKAA